MGFIVIIDIDMVYENMFMNERFLSHGMFQAWFMVFKHGNGLNSILIKYSYYKSYQWFIDIMHIDEYGFIRACLWKKGFMVFYGFGSTELSV